MKSMRQRYACSPGDSAGGLALCLALLGLHSACGGQVDERFSAESEDEYTEPLTRALIGTPDGRVVRTGPEGTVVVSTTAPARGGRGTGGAASVDEEEDVIFGTGGGTSSGGGGGRGGSGEGGSSGVDGSGFGLWHFDDCLPNSHFLTDSSGFGANAQQELGARCVPGISDQGVQIRSQRDVIQVPDEPQFTVRSRVAVAAWVNPRTVRGDQPIVIKRLNNQTSFSLGIHNGNIEMSVVLSDGTTVISRAPIQANEFTHVAGMFDGTFVFLFINGEQFGQIYAAGSLRNVFAPLRIGATTQSQHFDGVIDEVFVSTEAISKETLQALSCIHHPTSFTVDPVTSGPVAPGTVVSYDVAVSNNDVGACGDSSYSVFFNNGVDPGLSAEFGESFQFAAPGTTAHFPATVSGSEDADPGVHRLPFSIFASSASTFEQFDSELVYEMLAPTGCFVSSRRELMITSLSVVDDPVRTLGNASGTGGVIFPPPGGSADAGAPPPSTPPSSGNGSGVWSFAHLLRELAPTPEAAPRMLEQMLKSFTTEQVVNGFRVAPRPGMQTSILNPWPRTANGELDLDRAPLTLQAIVNRLDVRDLAVGSGGEGRFVFGVNGPEGFALQFTMIFEYNLPAKTEQDVLDWANLWHGLQAHPFPSEEYNAALENVTRRFSSRNASPGSVNGSALFSFRTNEIDLGLGAPWELRQFELSPQTGFFQQIPLSETPDLNFNGTSTFADFVNQNAPAIIALVPGGTGNTVPLRFEGQNFQAGSVFNELTQWFADGIEDPDARFHASLNTCNGCHGPETNSGFLQITPRGFTGGEAGLAPFITGTTVFDPITSEPRTLNDLGRRRADMTQLVCPPGTLVSTPPPPPGSGGIRPVPVPSPIPGRAR